MLRKGKKYTIYRLNYGALISFVVKKLKIDAHLNIHLEKEYFNRSSATNECKYTCVYAYVVAHVDLVCRTYNRILDIEHGIPCHAIERYHQHALTVLYLLALKMEDRITPKLEEEICRKII